MNFPSTAVLACAIVATASCATPDRVRGHLLQSTDRSLPAYQDNLVIMDVRIESDAGALKLREMGLQDVNSGLPWRIPLFANAIMKTRAIPFEERDGAIYHSFVVDLPAGTYSVNALELQDYIVDLAGPDVSRRFDYELPTPVLIEVVSSSEPQYLGMLDLRATAYVSGSTRDATSQILEAAHDAQTGGSLTMESLDPGGTDAVLGAAASATAVDVQTMRGTVDVAVTPPDASSTEASGKRFRALSGSTIAQGRMWIASETP